MDATEQGAIAEVVALRSALPQGAVALQTQGKLPAASLRLQRDGSYLSLLALTPEQTPAADIEVSGCQRCR